jgi:TolB protein
MVLAIVLLVGSCAVQRAPERSAVPTITAPTTTVHTLADDELAELSALPGRLLVLGPESAIWTMRPDRSEQIVLAEPDPDIRRRTVPTWSPDGASVAWTDELEDVSGLLHVVAADGSDILEVPTPMVAEYIDWSPDGSRLAIMGNDDFGEFRLAVVDLAGTLTELAQGSPMSIDWNGSGDHLVVRVEDTVELVAVDGSSRRQIPSDGAHRLAAFVNETVTATRRSEVGHILALTNLDGTAVDPIVRFGDPAAYVVDPAGERIAIVGLSSIDASSVADFAASAEPDDGIPSLIWNQLTVIDLATRSTRVVDESRLVSFSWSPDGASLQWATIIPTGAGELQWHSETGGIRTDYPAFSPGGDFARSYLAFFDQFERSVTLWAPDSSAFAYAGGEPGTISGIWVQPIGRPEPILVSEGSSVSWQP